MTISHMYIINIMSTIIILHDRQHEIISTHTLYADKNLFTD